MAATLFQHVSAGDWIANAYLTGELPLASLNASLPLDEIYRGLTFAK